MVPAVAAEAEPVGLELYTVRSLAEQDLLGTLGMVAGIGYREVEFAGYFGHDPKAIRARLDGLGLSAPAAHIALTELQQRLPAVIEAALVIGHRYVVMPYLSDAQRAGGIDTYYRLAEFLNGASEQLRAEGLHLAYHNHAFEFETVDGELPYDVLLNECEPENLIMEMDLYWVHKAGFSAQAYFDRFPGRFQLWHVKDSTADGDFADVGDGVIDFPAIFAKRDVAGLRHCIVERDVTDDLQRTLATGYSSTRELLNSST